MEAGREWPPGANDVVVGRISRNERGKGVLRGQNCVALIEPTLASPVETPIAFGMTNAVIFFSIVRISVNGMTSWREQCILDATHIRDPAKNVGVEAEVVLRDV